MTSPLTKTWSPRSTSSFHACSDSSPTRGERHHRLDAAAVARLQRCEAQLAGVAAEHDAPGDRGGHAGLGARLRARRTARAASGIVSVIGTATGYAPPAASDRSAISRSRLASRTAFCSKTSSSVGSGGVAGVGRRAHRLWRLLGSRPQVYRRPPACLLDAASAPPRARSSRANRHPSARDRPSSGRAPTDTLPGLSTPACASSSVDCRTIERENSVAVSRRLGIRRAGILGDDDRLAAQLDGERLRDRAARAPARSPLRRRAPAGADPWRFR